MFTGIVRERWRVASVEEGPDGVRLEISAPETASQLGIGDSVSVSGACLTATEVSNGSFSVTAVAETLSRTTLGCDRLSTRTGAFAAATSLRIGSGCRWRSATHMRRSPSEGSGE